MRSILVSVFFILSIVYAGAQTFNFTGGNIPGTGSTPFCFNAPVTGVGTINSTRGLAQVCLSITHPSVDELEILLQAPDGTYVPLSIQNGAAGADNYTNTCFSATASTPIKFSTAPFTGTFLPEGHIGAVNNGQSADGNWKLCILDRKNSANFGTLNNWKLTFSTNPAPQPPAFPNCNTIIPSNSNCGNATSICDFNGACGSTKGNTASTWPNLTSQTCFTLQNNSFVKFIADAPTVSFSVWVTSSINKFNSENGGIQMLFFSTPTCGGTVTTYGCYKRIYPYPPSGKPLITLIYATGLIPGQTYYLLTDGCFSDDCDFSIAANSGVNVLNVTSSSSSNNICLGETVTLNATGGNGAYEWFKGTQPSPVVGTGANFTTTPSASGAITYQVKTTVGLGCPATKDITINVNDVPAKPVIVPTPASCIAAGKSTISNYVSTLTYNFNPTGPTVGSNGAINGMTTGTNYTVTASNGNCTSPASPPFRNDAQLTSSILPPTITTTNPSCSASSISTITNYINTLTYTFNPAGPSIGTNGLINGMIAGSNYTVSASDGICNSPASNPFSLAPQLPTPVPPKINTTSATCTNIGTSTITNYNNTFTYTFSPTGPSIGTNGIINGMNTNTNYTVTAGNGNCTSNPSATFSNAAPVIPSAPEVSITQPTCNNNKGIINISPQSGGTYSIDDNTYQSNNIFSGLNPGNYIVTVKNTAGCISTATPALLTQPTCITTNDLFVPNAFTPNGDGKNDVLLVKGTSIKSMQFLIYNQWGEKVFESTRQDNGWDGTTSGKSQPVGVYVYVLKAELVDGTTQQLKGSITLIR